MPTTLLQSDLPGLTLRHRGKVRDVFDLPRDRLPADAPEGDCLLMVATDRLSAFDVVLPDPIPGKGEMLCQISNFWFAKTAHLMPNHLTGIDVASVLPEGVDPALYARRAVVTRRLRASTTFSNGQSVRCSSVTAAATACAYASADGSASTSP